MNIDDVRLNFDDSGILLVNMILAGVMFGVALDLKLRDFTVIFIKPKAPIAGLFAQLILLQAFTYLLTLIIRPAPSVALGMILVAACPSGNMSNFITHLAKGNTALSVSVTALSTLAALFMTPLNLSFWGHMNPATSALLKEVNVSAGEVMFTVFLVLGLPLSVGMSVARFLPKTAKFLRTPMRYFSLFAFGVFLLGAFAKNFGILVSHGGVILLVVIIHNATALTIGYLSGKALRLPERDCRAVSIEVGIQNSALALTLIFSFFSGLGGMALVAGLWGIWHMVSGMAIAAYWGTRVIVDTPALEAEEV